MANVFWSREQIDEIARMWMAGKSARQIGEFLGVTRNAIIGIVHRHQIKRDGPPKVTEEVKAQRDMALQLAREAAERKRVEREAAERKRIVPPKPKRVAPEHIIDPTGFWKNGHSAPSMRTDGGVALVDAEWFHCRFPLGRFADVATHVCGERKRDGSSFCAAHHKLVYRGTVTDIRREEDRRKRERAKAKRAAA